MLSLWPAAFESWPARVDGGIENGREIEHLAADLNQSARDARDFEQIVDEPNEMVDLAVHDCTHADRDGVLHPGRLQQLQGCQQRRQWIAQLVAERGQKLVFAPVGEPERFLSLNAFRQMTPNLILPVARTESAADGAHERRPPQRPLQQRDVGEHAHRFG